MEVFLSGFLHHLILDHATKYAKEMLVKRLDEEHVQTHPLNVEVLHVKVKLDDWIKAPIRNQAIFFLDNSKLLQMF